MPWAPCCGGCSTQDSLPENFKSQRLSLKRDRPEFDLSSHLLCVTLERYFTFSLPCRGRREGRKRTGRGLSHSAVRPRAEALCTGQGSGARAGSLGPGLKMPLLLCPESSACPWGQRPGSLSSSEMLGAILKLRGECPPRCAFNWDSRGGQKWAYSCECAKHRVYPCINIY